MVSQSMDLMYTIDDIPPWHICWLLGFQHYLTMFGGTLVIPLLLASSLCMGEDYVGLSQLVGTTFFVSGISTLLQTTIGCRLPIVQGATFAFLAPAIAILNQPQWMCSRADISGGNSTNISVTQFNGSEYQEGWKERLRELQGAIMVASAVQIVIGFSGVMGFVLNFVGPLAITPTVTLIGLSLFDAASVWASKQWWIAVMTVVLILAFSQYLKGVPTPCPSRTNGGWTRKSVPVFKLFPIIIGMVLSWFVCFLLTVTNILPSKKGEWGFEARTDVRIHVIEETDWFRFPYPGQWGSPTVSASSAFGMIAGVLASVIESIGDYYACARLSGIPPPPSHAINRGIGVEGLCCLLAGIWGTGNGTTSYSENIGAIAVTKVCSRRVVQWGATILLVLGCLGKFGALFVTIPDPVIGGMFMVTFGMVVAVGLSNLQFVDMNSSRNLCVLGMSLFLGLCVPKWVNTYGSSIETGRAFFDQTIRVLLSTSMFVGGGVGLLLDNTIPGSPEERGLTIWRSVRFVHSEETGLSDGYECYDLPVVHTFISKWRWTKYLPFCPGIVSFRREGWQARFENRQPEDACTTIQ